MTGEPNGPRALAEKCIETIAQLRQDLKDIADPQERTALRLRIRSCRSLERWARSRQGYADEE